MNIQFQRKVDRIIGVPLCALFSLIDRISGLFGDKTPATPPPPRRILIILLSEMGSLVLAQPMFERLKQRYPDASLHVLLFGKNREVLDLLGVVPPENVLTLNDRSLGGLVTDSLRAIKTLRSLKFDAVIDCELFARISSLFAYLSGAKLHVGFHPHTQEGLYRGSFINRPVLYNPYRHLTQQFLTMVDALESDAVPLNKYLPEPFPEETPTVDFPPEELAQTASELHKRFPAISDKPLVLLYPSGGILPIRAWAPENYITVAKSLLADGYAVAIIGLKEDKPLGRRIVQQCQSEFCVDLTGYTVSVRHLLTLFHRASLLITNDGGPGQFAALTQLPTITFFGPETPQLYQPLGANGYCFFLSLSCSPCLTAYNHRASPCDGDNQCLKQITPVQVLSKAREMLA